MRAARAGEKSIPPLDSATTRTVQRRKECAVRVAAELNLTSDKVCRQFVASAAGESGHMANGKTESMNSRKEERKCTNRFLPA